MTVLHELVQVERTFSAPLEQVFSAWQDSEALGRWYLPGDESWSSEVVEHNFRVGGVKRLTFGPRGEIPYSEDCRYEDIVINERIVYTMTVAAGTQRLTASLVTIELSGTGSGTRVLMTDQLAILDGGDTAEERRQGWVEVLDRLQDVLGA